MAIQIKNDPAGGYRPAIICDGCGNEITSAEDGTAAWVVDDENAAYFSFSTMHRNGCFHEFEAEAGGLVGDIPLPAFLIYLERGLNLDRKEAKHQARILSMLDDAHPSVIEKLDAAPDVREIAADVQASALD